MKLSEQVTENNALGEVHRAWLIPQIKELEKFLATQTRMNEAVRRALDQKILGFEGSGMGIIQAIRQLRGINE